MAAVPTIKQLRYLIALSETLSFTKAAERCFVGQSTLSAGLKELEDTLGAQLVERDKHSVSLTPTGRGVVEQGLALDQGLLQHIGDLGSRGDGALAVLGRVERVHRRQLPRGLGDRAEARD